MIALGRVLRVLGIVALGFGFSSVQADVGAGMTHEAGAGQTGGEIYLHICQGCHMPKGQGATGAGHYPSLANSSDLAGRLGEIVAATVVLNGRNGMPAFGHPRRPNPSDDPSLLSDAQIAEIVNYVRSHFGNHFPERLTAAQVTALRHPISTPTF